MNGMLRLILAPAAVLMLLLPFPAEGSTVTSSPRSTQMLGSVCSTRSRSRCTRGVHPAAGRVVVRVRGSIVVVVIVSILSE